MPGDSAPCCIDAVYDLFCMKGSVEGLWAWTMLVCQRSSLPRAQPAAEFRG